WPAFIRHWKIGEEFQVKSGRSHSSAPEIYGDSSGRKGLGETPAGRSPRRLPSRPRKAKYISGAVYQHTLRHTDLALRKPKKAYKNRVLKILVPLRYREKLDTNLFRLTLEKVSFEWYHF